MSYEKHTWETGETITAEKLNNLEDGVASSGGGGEQQSSDIMYCVLSYDENAEYWELNKTYNDVKPYLESGKLVMFMDKGTFNTEITLWVAISNTDANRIVTFRSTDNSVETSTITFSGYNGNLSFSYE